MIKLYVIGFVGNLGTKVLIEEKLDDLIRQFSKEFIVHVKNQIEESLIEDGFNPSLIMQNSRDEHSKLVNHNILDVEEIGKGGVLTALWKICDRNKWGLKYSLRKIPILQGTIEIANYFDINPYRLLTRNSYIAAIADEQTNCSNEYVGFRMGELQEPQLAYVGDITNEKKRVRIDGEAEAFLTKDYKDEIDKILHNYTKEKYE